MFGRRSEQDKETDRSGDPISEDIDYDLMSVLANRDGKVVQEPVIDVGPAYIEILQDFSSK